MTDLTHLMWRQVVFVDARFRTLRWRGPWAAGNVPNWVGFVWGNGEKRTVECCPLAIYQDVSLRTAEPPWAGDAAF